ncbi:MAG: DegT/DnrJ/EryC1/StrS family aminotransferase [Candidatus Cloacimonadales bacterium]|jgi:dTDP-4-amino-4,6-dideoxygalactose transaminase|nr:DegT/DnrJ/EryC1/StrS family aminotransferase [Candidatus Cloacimonadota bacterium]MDD2650451.1 DegT/DnrJ/EryC1/StrS family aminotransferase [Candidatus Cloacimonadota bacterium]MDX9976670.1 DegT/DnrJ/EryC1/StrS family aminotransferase [Candidatus Cloacimonadales bacterium]
MKVQLLDLDAQYRPIMSDIRHEMDKVLSSHQYILGPAVKDFEKQMQEYLQVKHAIGCANGTDALVLALKALEIKEGDEVITTPFSFFATASCIYRVGAKPIFVDINEKTFNINPDLIEKSITKNTKAIIVVHLFGQAAEMDKIMAIAKKHNLYVIEDNAQGIGCKYDGQYAGGIGDIGTLSFFPSKNLGCMGDGGMCLTQSDDLGAKLRQLRTHGENPKYFHKWVGLNSRLDTLQAAVLSVKLRHLQTWSEARRANAAKYYELLKEVKDIKLPYIHPKAESIYNQFTIVTEKRDELMKELQSKEIGCAIYYPLPLHLQECFAYLGYKEGDCPNSERLAKQVLSIPIYSELPEEQIRFVADTIINFYNK